MASLKVAFVVAVLYMVVVSAHMAHARINCGRVAVAVSPCLGYLRRGGRPQARCCNGVRNLHALAKTTVDRRTACNCLKTFARGLGRGVNANNAVALPRKCRVNIPYKISISTNCNTYVKLIITHFKCFHFLTFSFTNSYSNFTNT